MTTKNINLYTFKIDDEIFYLYAPTKLSAMAKMNKWELDKRGIGNMAWFGHEDDKSIPKNTYICMRGNYHD
jgi:hypothetical protein